MGPGKYLLDGELTMNGMTRPVTVEVDFHGVACDIADRSTHASFSATTTVNGRDFGVDFSMPLGADELALGNQIAVELELQFVAVEQ